MKSIWRVVLISLNLPTHTRIWYSVNRISCGIAAPTGSSAGSLWSLNFPESSGAVVSGVGHVEVGHSHPSSSTPAAHPAHVTVLQTSAASTSILNPVVSRGTTFGHMLTGWGRVEKGTEGQTTTVHLWDDLTQLLGLGSFVALQHFPHLINDFWRMLAILGIHCYISIVYTFSGIAGTRLQLQAIQRLIDSSEMINDFWRMLAIHCKKWCVIFTQSVCVTIVANVRFSCVFS